MSFTYVHIVRGMLLASIMIAAFAKGANVAPNEAETVAIPSSITREQAVSIALVRNPEYLAIKQDVKFARATRQRVDGWKSPTLFWEFEEAKSTDPGSFGNQSVGIEQSIDWMGATRARKRVANLGINIATISLERARLRVVSQVSKAVDQVLLAQSINRLVSETIQYANEALAITRSRFQSGQGSYVDLLRIRIAAKRLDAEGRNTIIKLKRSKRALAVLLGAEESRPLKVLGQMDYVSLTSDRASWVATTLERSPSLKIMQQEVDHAKESYVAIRKERGPNMTLGIGRQRLYDGFNADYAWTGKVELSFPLPGTDRQRGREGEANAAYNAMRHRNNQRRLALKARLQQHFEKTASLSTQLADYQRIILPDVKDQRKAAQQAYRVRRIDALNLLDVYRTFLDTQIDYLETLAEYKAARVDLDTLGENLSETEQ